MRYFLMLVIVFTMFSCKEEIKNKHKFTKEEVNPYPRYELIIAYNEAKRGKVLALRYYIKGTDDYVVISEEEMGLHDLRVFKYLREINDK